MNKQYKVLHIFSSFGGGISSLVLNLIENKNDDFVFDTMTFSYKGGEHFIDSIQRMGGCCYTMPRPKMDGYKSLFSFLNSTFKDNQYDAIHCHIAGYGALAFYTMAKRNKCKHFFLHAHTTRYDKKINRMGPMPAINRLINNYMAEKFLTCSDLAASYVFGDFFTKSKECILIPNGINEEKYRQLLTNERKEIFNRICGVKNEKTLKILHVGRFSNPKNHRFIIEIARSLMSKNIDYKMILVGNGELFDEIKESVTRNHLESNVVLLGRRTDINMLMQYASIIILPSFYEGLPTVALESQASGTPILISDLVTRQCDMGLGMVKFLPISDADVWVRELTNSEITHLDPNVCIDHIKNNNFTAQTSSQLYCNFLKRTIERG